jgi:hypothetical protein
MGAPPADGYNRSMKILVRAVISGFGFSLGAALFKKVSSKLGLGEDKPSGSRDEVRPDPDSVATDKGSPDPNALGATGFEGV